MGGSASGWGGRRAEGGLTVDHDELIAEFTRITRSEEGFVVEVRVIEWADSHTPAERWLSFASARPTSAAAEAFRRDAIRDARFFGVCEKCGQSRPRGWMHSRTVCQACAERDLGVVY